MPSAFAVGVRQTIHLIVESEGTDNWQCEVYDHADPSLTTDGLPLSLQLVGRPWEEAELLQTAAWCEKAIGFERREVRL